MRIETYAPDPPVYMTWHNQDGTWETNKQSWEDQIVNPKSAVWAPWTNSFDTWDGKPVAWEDIEVEPPEEPVEPSPPAPGNPNLPDYGDDLAGTNDVRIGDMRLLITAGGRR